MVKLIADWERSGAGAGMVGNHVDDNDDDDDREPMEYEFIDGDDQKSFLRERPPHILYLWHLMHKYGILCKVRQWLVGCSSVNLPHAPDVDTTSKKRKQLPGSIDQSTSDSGRIMKNMEQIADLINGLVDVARQSREMQQINMLYRRRKELEDEIGTLEAHCMDIELQRLDERDS